jgi:hypothetical protein
MIINHLVDGRSNRQDPWYMLLNTAMIGCGATDIITRQACLNTLITGKLFNLITWL